MSISISQSMQVTASERWRAIIGATFGLLITFLLLQWWSHWFEPWGDVMGFVAPMGASAIILFALPSSPLAQPWAILGGNVVSALVGLVFAHWVPEPLWACGMAVGVAMALMFAARCLHPPGRWAPPSSSHQQREDFAGNDYPV